MTFARSPVIPKITSRSACVPATSYACRTSSRTSVGASAITLSPFQCEERPAEARVRRRASTALRTHGDSPLAGRAGHRPDGVTTLRRTRRNAMTPFRLSPANRGASPQSDDHTRTLTEFNGGVAASESPKRAGLVLASLIAVAAVANLGLA